MAEQEEFNKFQVIDSHFSMGQNTINFLISRELAERSLAVKDNPSFENLRRLKNVLCELYENFNSIISPQVLNDFEEKSTAFDTLFYDILDGRERVNMRNILLLQFHLKNMRYILISYLQKYYKYYYRMSSRQPTGLKNLDHLMQHNIFR